MTFLPSCQDVQTHLTEYADGSLPMRRRVGIWIPPAVVQGLRSVPPRHEGLTGIGETGTRSAGGDSGRGGCGLGGGPGDSEEASEGLAALQGQDHDLRGCSDPDGQAHHAEAAAHIQQVLALAIEPLRAGTKDAGAVEARNGIDLATVGVA